MQSVEIVKIYPTRYWVERTMWGSNHIMVQHEGMDAFVYATLNYNYAYTSNSGVHQATVALMKSLGVEESDIEWRSQDIQQIVASEKEAVLDVVQECAQYLEQTFGDQSITGKVAAVALQEHFEQT